MSKETRLILGLFLLVLGAIAASWPFRSAVAPPDEPRASEALGGPRPQLIAAASDRSTISGSVRSADRSQAIAGARVCAACASCEPTTAPPSFCTYSERDGRYELSQLTAAGYHVGASAHGYRPGSSGRGRPVFVAAGERREIDLVLSPGGASLSGSVLDATGGSVPFARVRAVRLSPPRVSLDVEADDAGRFALSLDPGPVSLIAAADGYTPARATAVAPNRGIELRLLPAATIEGSVVRARSHEPLAGAEVRAAPVSRPNSLQLPASSSGESGEFRLEGLGPGSYLVSAKSERGSGRLAHPIELEVADHVRGIVIEVATAASVRGQVVIEPGGEPCREGLVALGEPDPMQPQPSAAGALPAGATAPEQVADIRPDGSVLFAGVPPGSYFASVRCIGHRFHAGPAFVSVGEDPLEGLVWVVSPGATLRVRVVDSRGLPLADTPFFLRWPASPDAQARPISAHRSDHAGRFEMPGLAPGDYEVLPAIGRGAGDGVRAVVRDGDRFTDVTLALAASGQILLEVRDEAGAPIHGLRVVATEAAPSVVTPSARPRREHGLELGDGRYRVGPVRAGEYRVTAEDGVNPPSEALVPVQDGRTTERRFVVSRASSLRGIVLDEQGLPLADAWVSARAQQLSAAHAAAGSALATFGRAPPRVLTDREGRFSIPSVAADARYAVRATKSHGPAGNAAVQPNVAPGEWIELRLRPAAAVSGVVVDGSGRPVPSYRLQVAHSASELQQSREVADPSGRFSLADMPAGPLQLVAVTPRGEIGSLQLELSSGQAQSDVRLTLAAASVEPESTPGR